MPDEMNGPDYRQQQEQQEMLEWLREHEEKALRDFDAAWDKVTEEWRNEQVREH